MLNAQPSSNDSEAIQTQLLTEIRLQTKKKVAQMQVKAGKVINRNIAGGIFILSGHAVLYREQGGKKVFLDRLEPGRLFFESILNPDKSAGLVLIAETDCEIAVANLNQLKQTSRVLYEKISQALFVELSTVCQGAMDQIFTLRSGSAKARIVKRAQQVLSQMDCQHDSDWVNIGLSSELLREMAGVSTRQFIRLAPELKKLDIMKIEDGEIHVQADNLNAQETE